MTAMGKIQSIDKPKTGPGGSEEYGALRDGWTANRYPARRDTLDVTIYYPRCDGDRVRAVEVGLSDVRAADNIRISYDHERDGWKIEQARCFSWHPDDKAADPQWAEVAFVQAWARAESDEEADARIMAFGVSSDSR